MRRSYWLIEGNLDGSYIPLLNFGKAGCRIMGLTNGQRLIKLKFHKMFGKPSILRELLIQLTEPS